MVALLPRPARVAGLAQGLASGDKENPRDQDSPRTERIIYQRGKALKFSKQGEPTAPNGGIAPSPGTGGVPGAGPGIGG